MTQYAIYTWTVKETCLQPIAKTKHLYYAVSTFITNAVSTYITLSTKCVKKKWYQIDYNYYTYTSVGKCIKICLLCIDQWMNWNYEMVA